MPNSYRKGYRAENQLERIFKQNGINAKRVPLSGGSTFAKGDIHIEKGSKTLRVEVKVRKDAFNILYNTLSVNSNNIISIEQPSLESLVLMRLTDLLSILRGELSLEEVQEMLRDAGTTRITRGLKKVCDYLLGSDILVIKADRKDFLSIVLQKTLPEIF